MNVCELKNKKIDFDNFLNTENFSNFKNIEDGSNEYFLELALLEDKISNYIDSNDLSQNYQMIKYINNKLKNLEIPINRPVENIPKQLQLNHNFKLWNLANGFSALTDIFKNNIDATNFIYNNFNRLATQHCIIDTRTSAGSFPIVDTNKLLNEKVYNLKQHFVKDLINRLNLSGLEYLGIFDKENGADFNLYNKFMSEIHERWNSFDQFDPAKITLTNDSNMNDNYIFFDILALNNFDNLLNTILDGVIVYDKINSGDLNRTDYKLTLVSDNDVFLSTDLEYENVLNAIKNNTKQVISTIPKLNINLNQHKISYNSDFGQTLQTPELLQLSSFIQINQLTFKNTFLNVGENFDLYDNPSKSIETFLEKIHDFILNKNSNENYEAKSRFINKMGHLLSTSESLYEYLFNEQNRIIRDTKSISSIINNYHSRGYDLKLNILDLICQQIIQSTSPTMIEYDKNGALFEMGLQQEIYNKNVIQKALTNNQVFNFKSVIRDCVLKYSFITDSTDFEDSLTKLGNLNRTDKYSNMNHDTDLQLVIQGLFNIDISQNDSILSLLDDIDENANQIKTLFKAIADIITDNKKQFLDDSTNIIDIYDKSILKINDALKNFDFENVSQTLGFVLGLIPTPIFKDRNGNSLGVYRSISAAFMIPHLIDNYKLPNLDEKEKQKSQPGYTNIRERCNILARYPELLSNKNNSGYLSFISIPLSLLGGLKTEEARKLPAFVQDLKAFNGDFMSMLLSTKNGYSTSQMAVLMGAYSDKGTLPLLTLNLENKLFQKSKQIKFKDLAKNGESVLKMDYLFRSTNVIDQIDHIISDWKTILDNAKFNENIPVSVRAKLGTIDYDGRVRKWLLNSSDTFEKALRNLDSIKSVNDYSKQVSNISLYLFNQINALNKILVNLKKSDIRLYIGKIASDLGLSYVDILYGDFYKFDGGTVFQFNETLSQALYEVSNYDTFEQINFKLFGSPSGNRNSRYYSPESYLNQEYTLSEKERVEFKDYLFTEFLRMYKYNPQVREKLSQDFKITKCESFEDISPLVFSFFTLNNLFRHSALDLTVKEAYVDSYKGKLSYNPYLEYKPYNALSEVEERLNFKALNKLKSDRVKTAAKRYNIFTATFIPFMTKNIMGISNKTKISVIEDITGPVFNTIGQSADLDEYDGSGFVHPIQRRMESASLCDLAGTTTKKTFIPLFNDYYCGELKWASYEMSNELIRQSKNTRFDLEPIFRRMSDQKFGDVNLCKFFYHKQNNNKILLHTLVSKKVFSRAGFEYRQLISLTKLPETNTYTLQFKKCDENGNIIDNTLINSNPVVIDDLYSLYKVLGGTESMELKNNKLVPSEVVMDLLYKFTVNVGDIKNESDTQYTQDSVSQPLRKGFIGIFANYSSNKRCLVNVTSNKIWDDPNIPLNYSEVDLSTGGEQLKSEHTTGDSSTITEGTQLIQSMSQRGFTDEETNALLQAIAKIMLTSSESFNRVVDMLNNNSIERLAEEISNKIIKDSAINNTSYKLQILINKLKKEAERDGKPLILPLSLLTKDMIKTIAVDLNREVIKRQDPGLQAVLNPSSGFIQIYKLGDNYYTFDNLVNNEELKKLKMYEQQIVRFSDEAGLSIDSVILKLQAAIKNSNFKNICKYIKNINEDEDEIITILNFITIDLRVDNILKNTKDPDIINQANDFKQSMLKAYLNLAEDYIHKNPREFKFLTLDQINYRELEPGDTYIKNNQDSFDYKTIVTSRDLLEAKKSSELSRSDYIFLEKSKPFDLKPSIYKTRSNNWSENSYTSEEAFLSYLVNDYLDSVDLSKLQLSDSSDADIDQSTKKIIDFINYYLTKEAELHDGLNSLEDNNYINNIQELHAYLSDPRGKSQIKLKLEQLNQFKDNLKSYGFLISGNINNFRNYYILNPFIDFEDQLKYNIVNKKLNLLSNDQLYNILSFNANIHKFSSIIDGINKSCVKDNRIDFEAVKQYLSNNAFVVFDMLTLDKDIEFRNYLNDLSELTNNGNFNVKLEKITKEKKSNAQAIVPKNREQLNIGDLNISEIDPKFYKRAPTHYNINKSLIDEKNNIVNVDFVIRSFSKKYYIATTYDFQDSKLDEKYGSKILQPNELLIDSYGYRLYPKSKNIMYKLPMNDSLYQIRVKDGVETIVFLRSNNKDNIIDPIDDINQLIKSDKYVVSIQPFLTNLSYGSDLLKLRYMLEELKHIDTLNVFDDMFDTINSTIDSNLSKKHKMLNKSNQQDYINLCHRLYDDYNSLKIDYFDRFRNSLYQAFKKSLNVIASRIPTQNMSSIMSMDEVVFTNSNVNNVFVTKWQQWLQGSDYDIDKTFLLSYSFTNNGKFINWSPLFKDYNELLFKESCKLPLPTGKLLIDNDRIYKSNTSNYYNINFSDDIYDIYSTELINDYIKTNSAIRENLLSDLIVKYNIPDNLDFSLTLLLLNLKIIKTLLKRLEFTLMLVIPSDLKDNILYNDLVNKINKHNLYTPSSDGIKNLMISKMHDVICNYKNFITTQKSIDIATEKFTSELNKIPDAHTYNIDNNHTVSFITESAATGKDGVGVSANANKDYFSLLQYYNNYYRDNYISNVDEFIKNYKFNLKQLNLHYPEKSTINIDGVDTEVVNLKLARFIVCPIGDIRLNENYKKYYKDACRILFGESDLKYFNFFNQDAAQDTGAILSLAADNAKTFALDKMNGSTSFLPMILYLSMVGVNSDIIVKYFNSDSFKFLKQYVHQDILSAEKNELNDDVFAAALADINKEISENLTNTTVDGVNYLKQLTLMNFEIKQLYEIYKCGQELTNLALILKINQGVNVDEKKLLNIKSKLESSYNFGITDLAKFVDKQTGLLEEPSINESGTLYFSENLRTNILNLAERTLGVIFDSIDQNTKDNIFGYYAFKILKANELMKKANINMLTRFNFDRFLSDDQYKDAIKSVNDIYKHIVNIFDSISEMPHFLEMLNSYNNVLKIYTTVNAQSDFIINKVYDLYDGRMIDNLTEDEFENLVRIFDVYYMYNPNALLNETKRAYDDYIISHFLKYLGPQYKFDYALESGKRYEINFTSDFGLHQFIEFTNDIVIPALVSRDPGNNFLNGLLFNNQEYTKTKNIFRGFNLNLNTMQSKLFDGSVKFNTIQEGFNDIADVKLADLLNIKFNNERLNIMTVGDVFWLYNTIMKHVSPRLHGFDSLFLNMYNDENSFMYRYMKYTQKYDSKELQVDYPQDLLMAALYRKNAYLTGNKIRFRDSKYKPVSFKYIDKNKDVRTRFFVNIPINQSEGIDHNLIVEALKYGIINGDITINFNLNC